MNKERIYLTEENKIKNLLLEIKAHPNWSENWYGEDGDAYSEPLISLCSGAVKDKHLNYLKVLIREAPEHKLGVLNDFVKTNILCAYLEVNDIDGIKNFMNKYASYNILNDGAFISSFYIHLTMYSMNNDINIVNIINSYIDPNFEALKKVFPKEYSYISVLEKSHLNENLKEQLDDKINTKKHKV